jgi:hypothetical protein
MPRRGGGRHTTVHGGVRPVPPKANATSVVSGLWKAEANTDAILNA